MALQNQGPSLASGLLYPMPMGFNPDFHHRRSIRLVEYDYSRTGAYFVTICTQNRECLFGDIVDGMVRLNEWGKIIKEEWFRTESVRPNIRLDAYTIMPNHFHGIIVVADSVGARRCLAHKERATHRVAPTSGIRPDSLGSIIGQFKSNVTRRINASCGAPGIPVWQRNYFEHVIRNDEEWNRTREYIQNNPLNWETDEENPGKFL